MSAITARALAASTALASLTLLPVTAAAQDAVLLPELLISASQVPITAREAGSAVTVITGEEIEERGDVTVVDSLRSQPGLSVGVSGPRGTLSSVRIRGEESRHTLVMIDGVVANRPGDSAFDFGTLLASDIERIEIVRGPQSGIFGSNAHAGVINILTKSGRGVQGVEVDARFEGGSPASGLGAATLRGSHGPIWGSLSVAAAGSEGFNVSRFGSERDGFDTINGTAKAGVELTDWFAIDGMLSVIRHNVESDPEDYAFPPTPTYGLVVDGDQFTESQDVLGRISAQADLLDGAWTHRLTGTFLDSDVEGYSDGSQSGGSRQGRQTLAYQTDYRFDTPELLNASHTVTGLVEYREETYRNTVLSSFSTEPAEFQLGKRTRDELSLATEYRVDFAETLSLSGAVRRDLNDGFEDATTWRLTGSYSLPTFTRIHASAGTGITNPSMIDQFGTFGTFVGNPDLRPEESFTWDVGVEQTLFDGTLVTDVTYFNIRLEDEIQLVGFAPSTVVNSDGISRREGVEVAAQWNPLPWFSLGGAYTYTNSRDPEGRREVRRPEHAARLDGTLRFHENRGRFNLGVVYNGETPDDFFGTTPATRLLLDEYFLVDASIAYQVTPEMEIYARAENLFDEDYEEVFSYQAPGFAAYAGVKIRLGAAPAPSGL